MFFKIVLNKIFGYVRITVEGFFIEKFINLCKFKGIIIWGIKREKASIIHVNISINDFKKVKNIAKKTKCRVHIQRKKGMPFILNKYRKRKIFVIGFILIAITIIFLSNFIWNIEIVGNEKISTDEIIGVLRNNGLEIGKFKRTIDKNSIINSIRLERNDISWMGIYIQGTNALVKIVEADDKPKIINDNEYCNIVSNKECVIEKISANNGTAMVKKGDIVKNGDVLISGTMEGKYTGIRYVHASGEIQAKVWYSQKEKVELNQVIKEKTGQNEKKYGIKFNNFQINFYKTLSKFQKYDTIYERQKIKIFSNFYLPLEIVKCNNYEIIENQQNYTVDEAKNIAIKQAEEKLNSQINSMENIKYKNINVNQNKEYVEAEITYEVLENIGTEEKIVF